MLPAIRFLMCRPIEQSGEFNGLLVNPLNIYHFGISRNNEIPYQKSNARITNIVCVHPTPQNHHIIAAERCESDILERYGKCMGD